MSELTDLIFATGEPQPVPVATPEWPGTDGKLFARRLTLAEKLGFSDRRKELSIPDGAGFVAYVVALGTVDVSGSRVFADDQWRQIMDSPGCVAVERLFRAIDRLNVISAAAEAELEKNSDAPGA